MTRNVRTYDHYCVVARTLERVGDRWSLLVVRDLVSGPKRFTDLMDRLGGITPKTLTLRLRELDENGILVADREPGRREVWYELTPAGRDLVPVIDALGRWGMQHAWRPPRAGEALHIEHPLFALALVLNDRSPDRGPARWHLHFLDAGDYTVEGDGDRWSVSSGVRGDAADVVVTATTPAWMLLVGDPRLERAAELGIDISGDQPALDRLEAQIRIFNDARRAARG